MRLPHIRHVIAGVIVASVGVVGTSLLAAPVLTEQSRAGTSYVARLPDNEPLTSVIYDTIAGSLFFKRTADRLVDGLQTDDERIDALVQWTHENVRPQFAAPDRIVQDNAYRIVQRGFGFCDQDAHVFATLAHYAGYDVQLRFLVWPDGVSHHTVAEVKVGDRWIEADPWIGAVIRDGGGRAMTVDDLVRDPAVLGRFGYDVLGVELKPDYFVNGIVFRTYPYEGPGRARLHGRQQDPPNAQPDTGVCPGGRRARERARWQPCNQGADTGRPYLPGSGAPLCHGPCRPARRRLLPRGRNVRAT